MKVSLILTLAGLSAAAPAVLSNKFSDPFPSTGSSLLPSFPKATPTAASRHVFLPFKSSLERSAAGNDTDSSGDDDSSSEDEDGVSAGPVSISIQKISLTGRSAAGNDTDSSDDENNSSDDEADVFVGPVSISTQERSAGDDTDSLDEDLDSFQMDSTYSRLAKEQSEVPSPYALVIENYNKTAIHQAIETHRHEVSDADYDTYDASLCAEHCNEHRACNAFAIYIERDVSCDDCTNPEAIVVAACDLYNTVLRRPDIREEAELEKIQGQTITRAVRGYNGYNRIQDIATVIATRTVTFEAPAVAYRTVFITSTSLVTSTVEHTVSGSDSTITSLITSTVEHTVSGSDNTVTHTILAPASTVTSTLPATTVTKTHTELLPPIIGTKSLFTTVWQPTHKPEVDSSDSSESESDSDSDSDCDCKDEIIIPI